MKVFFLFIFLLLPQLLWADEKKESHYFDYRVNLSFENLNFLVNRSQFSLNDQETLTIEPELVYHNDQNLKVKIKPRLRIDLLDSSRNRYLPNETWVNHYTKNWEFSTGLMIQQWGVSHFFNPSDILNRRDLAENLYTPETLGDLFLNVIHQKTDWAGFSEFTFHLMVKPWLQETPLPQNDMRYALRGTTQFISYQLAEQQEKPDFLNSLGFALRLAGSRDLFDVAFMYYHGPELAPGYFFTTDLTGSLRLKPFYYTLDSFSLNGQLAWKKFVFSLETALQITKGNQARFSNLAGANQNVIPSSYLQFVPGVRYDWENLFGVGTLSLHLEYLGEDDQQSNVQRELRPFKNDLFVGLRFSFNNTALTTIELGWVKDLNNAEMISLVDIESKIVGDLRLSIQALQMKRSNDRLQPLSFFENNSYIMTKLSYQFGGSF